MLLLDGISTWLKFKLMLFQANDWPELCKTGKIGVRKMNAKKRYIPPLTFQNYNTEYDAYIENNGHTVTISINATTGKTPTLRGGCLDGEYVLDNIHFHWKSDHTLDGTRFPLEAHLVHFKKTYNNLKSALKDPNGLCILAVMFKEKKHVNPKVDHLVCSTEEVARSVKRPVAVTGGVVIDNFLPKNRCKYYMHEGFLSENKCRDGVKWIIFEEILPIGQEQIYQLNKVSLVKPEISQHPKEEVVYYTEGLTVAAIGEFIKEAMGFGN